MPPWGPGQASFRCKGLEVVEFVCIGGMACTKHYMESLNCCVIQTTEIC